MPTLSISTSKSSKIGWKVKYNHLTSLSIQAESPLHLSLISAENPKLIIPSGTLFSNIPPTA